ncbi:hypothetical protein CDD80_6783 [Ophiocordyceps camponoti-rufipedis]|uniref:Uncharacterized protein n=1 Tax=Ophiocordyceps camponoti-rufipedis TaxID=2004952 RepID=A0A2C5YP40_9HYPO|nr:hypothetical protein CDD80_6783 [Ophiocordyceps camponoti-rufipedis]
MASCCYHCHYSATATAATTGPSGPKRRLQRRCSTEPSNMKLRAACHAWHYINRRHGSVFTGRRLRPSASLRPRLIRRRHDCRAIVTAVEVNEAANHSFVTIHDMAIGRRMLANRCYPSSSSASGLVGPEIVKDSNMLLARHPCTWVVLPPNSFQLSCAMLTGRISRLVAASP